MIDRVTIDKILDAANIVDVVSDFVTLKRSGANLKGLCPFHDDRTPSFVVSPAKNLCKCFSCGEGGSPVQFIMKHESLSYPEALRYLARKYGIEVKEKDLTPEEMQSANDKESMFIINEWALKWFRQQLNETTDGRAIGLAYFRSRGFRDDILEKFQVGFCPSSRTALMTTAALKEGYLEKYLVNVTNSDMPQASIGTGLSIKRDDGTYYDRFRNRVIWPIFTISGKVAGFGARVLDAATKGVSNKYINSAESIIYSKRKELFGIYQARESIRRNNLCYLVEGYTDVMAMHQHGVENVVASSGTALTTEQIRLIHRLTDNITVIFDGDEAGIHASQRGIDMILAEGMNVKLLLLPDGDDPDSFGRKHNAQEYQAYLNEHQVDFISYKTGNLSAAAQDDPVKMGELIHGIATSIAMIPDEIQRALYIRKEANAMQLDERLISNAVAKELRRIQEEKAKERERTERRRLVEQGVNIDRTGQPQPANPQPAADTTKPEKPEVNPKETAIIQILLRHGEKLKFYMSGEDDEEIPITVAQFIDLSLKDDGIGLSEPTYAKILQETIEHIHEEGFSPTRYFINHPDTEVSTIAFRLGTDSVPLSKFHGELPEDDRLDEIVPNLIANLKLEKVQAELRQIIDMTKSVELQADKEKYRTAMSRFQELQKKARELAKQCGERVILR